MSLSRSERRHAAALRHGLIAAGLTVQKSCNLEAFERGRRQLGRGPVTPVFERRHRPKGFWLALRTASGGLVGLQAVVDLGGLGLALAEILAARRPLLMSPGIGVDPAASAVTSLVAQGIRGRAIYHGEFFLVPDWQGRGLGPDLIRLMQVEVWAAWRPAVFFGLTLPHTSSAGFARAMGYEGYEPEAMTWRDAEGEVVRAEGLVYSTAAHLEALASGA